MPDVKREHQVIEFFCTRMSELTRVRCEAVEWPDEEARGPGECDAIVDRGGERWALDHTRLESFNRHVYDDVRFMEVVLPAEQALAPHFPGERVSISVPVGTIPRGDSVMLAEAFANDCLQASQTVPVAEEYDSPRVHRVAISTTESEVHISRMRHHRSGVFVSRSIDMDEQQHELTEGLQRQLTKKQVQLGRQKDKNLPTVLLLDTEDFALLNEFTIAEAYVAASRGAETSNIDEIFIVDEHTKSAFVWPLRFRGVEPPDYRWFSEFRRAQSRLIWGDGEGSPYLESLKCDVTNQAGRCSLA